jgi:hypothetical protein
MDASVFDVGPDAAEGTGLDGGSDGGGEPLLDAGSDASRACDPACPPGFCVDGRCEIFGSCCETGYCAPGYVCDFFRCECIEVTGCCAGEPCAAGEVCDFSSCTCARADDCCRFPVCELGEICSADCRCELDTSCGPGCTGDRFCDLGTCRHRCEVEGCADPTLYCSEAEGCIPPRCTDEECLLAGDPPLACDPATGCFDPCAIGDWIPCTDRGGHCFGGECIEDTCRATGARCAYRFDCCGNTVCMREDEPDPDCDPRACPPEPVVAPRLDLCACSIEGYCVDLWGGAVRHLGWRR